MTTSPPPRIKVSLLDYGAGNVRSVRNALTAAGAEVTDISTAAEIRDASCIVFPGVGSYGSAMSVLVERGWDGPLREYLSDFSRPFLGICLGMQTLFASSEETGGVAGLGVVDEAVVKFSDKDASTGEKIAVPQIGWNGRIEHMESPLFRYLKGGSEVYFVHSFYVPLTEKTKEFALTTTTYGGVNYVSSIQRGNVVATQFHPEKSGKAGLDILRGFLDSVRDGTLSATSPLPTPGPDVTTSLVKRIVVALDVRSNDHGDLVVTKGDQYDVREKPTADTPSGRGGVRNLGKPVSLASRYYEEGADELAFLNITSFRQGVVDDMPMLQVLEAASKTIFVPLTVGGGIRSYTDGEGKTYSALEVANLYFRAGADKVSLGSDAVYAAEKYLASGGAADGTSSIETISHVYGAQAVVISIDPKRIYVDSADAADPAHTVVPLPEGQRGPDGQAFCWWQATVRGGREARNICAVTVAAACEKLGAGEVMLNCIDMDGQCKGYDHLLMVAVASAVGIPVIASSGAGKPEHFTDVFKNTPVHAALAAGMFHRKEVGIDEVKTHMAANGVPARICE